MRIIDSPARVSAACSPGCETPHRAAARVAKAVRGFGPIAAISAGLLLVAGCDSPPRASAVDAVKAREALKTVLDSWKSGQKPEALKNNSPSITAQDLDWISGLVLADYRIVSEGTNDDANLRIPVELKLRDPGGRELSKRVSYVVGTNPSVTVFREL